MPVCQEGADCRQHQASTSLEALSAASLLSKLDVEQPINVILSHSFRVPSKTKCFAQVRWPKQGQGDCSASGKTSVFLRRVSF